MIDNHPLTDFDQLEADFFHINSLGIFFFRADTIKITSFERARKAEYCPSIF